MSNVPHVRSVDSDSDESTQDLGSRSRVQGKSKKKMDVQSLVGFDPHDASEKELLKVARQRGFHFRLPLSDDQRSRLQEKILNVVQSMGSVPGKLSNISNVATRVSKVQLAHHPEDSDRSKAEGLISQNIHVARALRPMIGHYERDGSWLPGHPIPATVFRKIVSSLEDISFRGGADAITDVHVKEILLANNVVFFPEGIPVVGRDEDMPWLLKQSAHARFQQGKLDEMKTELTDRFNLGHLPRKPDGIRVTFEDAEESFKIVRNQLQARDFLNSRLIPPKPEKTRLSEKVKKSAIIRHKGTHARVFDDDIWVGDELTDAQIDDMAREVTHYVKDHPNAGHKRAHRQPWKRPTKSANSGIAFSNAFDVLSLPKKSQLGSSHGSITETDDMSSETVLTGHDCTVCGEENSSGFNCPQCRKVTCSACVISMVTHMSFACPTCRYSPASTNNASIIASSFEPISGDSPLPDVHIPPARSNFIVPLLAGIEAFMERANLRVQQHHLAVHLGEVLYHRCLRELQCAYEGVEWQTSTYVSPESQDHFIARAYRLAPVCFAEFVASIERSPMGRWGRHRNCRVCQVRFMRPSPRQVLNQTVPIAAPQLMTDISIDEAVHGNVDDRSERQDPETENTIAQAVEPEPECLHAAPLPCSLPPPITMSPTASPEFPSPPSSSSSSSSSSSDDEDDQYPDVVTLSYIENSNGTVLNMDSASPSEAAFLNGREFVPQRGNVRTIVPLISHSMSFMMPFISMAALAYSIIKGRRNLVRSIIMSLVLLCLSILFALKKRSDAWYLMGQSSVDTSPQIWLQEWLGHDTSMRAAHLFSQPKRMVRITYTKARDSEDRLRNPLHAARGEALLNPPLYSSVMDEIYVSIGGLRFPRLSKIVCDRRRTFIDGLIAVHACFATWRRPDLRVPGAEYNANMKRYGMEFRAHTAASDNMESTQSSTLCISWLNHQIYRRPTVRYPDNNLNLTMNLFGTCFTDSTLIENPPAPSLSIVVHNRKKKLRPDHRSIVGTYCKELCIIDFDGVIALPAYVSDPQSAANQIAATIQRFGREMPDRNPLEMELFVDYSKKIIERFVLKANPQEIISSLEWLQGCDYPKARFDAMMRVLEGTESITDSDLVCTSFIKQEIFGEDKAPRAINSYSDIVKLFLGPYVKLVDSAIYAIHDGRHNIKHLIPSEWRSKIEATVGSGRVTCTDFSTFEAHHYDQYADILAFLFRHVLSNFDHQGNDVINRLVLGTNVCKFSRITVTVRQRLMSGALWTSSGNQIINLLLMSYMSAKMKAPSASMDHLVDAFDSFEGLCEGDDGICPEFPDPSNLVRDLGLRLKLETHDHYGRASFCGVLCDTDDGVILMDPVRVMRNIFLVLDTSYIKPTKVLSRIRARALSYLTIMPNTPVISILCHSVLFRTRHIDASEGILSMDNWHKVAAQRGLKNKVWNLPILEPKEGSRAVVHEVFKVSTATQIEWENEFRSRTVGPYIIDNFDLLNVGDYNHLKDFVSDKSTPPPPPLPPRQGSLLHQVLSLGFLRPQVFHQRRPAMSDISMNDYACSFRLDQIIECVPHVPDPRTTKYLAMCHLFRSSPMPFVQMIACLMESITIYRSMENKSLLPFLFTFMTTLFNNSVASHLESPYISCVAKFLLIGMSQKSYLDAISSLSKHPVFYLEAKTTFLVVFHAFYEEVMKTGAFTRMTGLPWYSVPFLELALARNADAAFYRLVCGFGVHYSFKEFGSFMRGAVGGHDVLWATLLHSIFNLSVTPVANQPTGIFQIELRDMCLSSSIAGIWPRIGLYNHAETSRDAQLRFPNRTTKQNPRVSNTQSRRLPRASSSKVRGVLRRDYVLRSEHDGFNGRRAVSEARRRAAQANSTLKTSTVARRPGSSQRTQRPIRSVPQAANHGAAERSAERHLLKSFPFHTRGEVPEVSHGGRNAPSVPVHAAYHHTLTVGAKSVLYVCPCPDSRNPVVTYSCADTLLTTNIFSGTFALGDQTSVCGLNCRNDGGIGDVEIRAGFTGTMYPWPHNPSALVTESGTVDAAARCMLAAQTTVTVDLPFNGSCVFGGIGPSDAPNVLGPGCVERSAELFVTHSENGKLWFKPGPSMPTTSNIVMSTLETLCGARPMKGASPTSRRSMSVTHHTLNNKMYSPGSYTNAGYPPDSTEEYSQPNPYHPFNSGQGYFYIRNTSDFSLDVTIQMAATFSCEVGSALTRVLAPLVQSHSSNEATPAENRRDIHAHVMRVAETPEAATTSASVATATAIPNISSSIRSKIMALAKKDPPMNVLPGASLGSVKPKGSFMSSIMGRLKTVGSKALHVAEEFGEAALPYIEDAAIAAIV